MTISTYRNFIKIGRFKDNILNNGYTVGKNILFISFVYTI